jgi:hypothetical protein
MLLANEARGPISMWQSNSCTFKLQMLQLKAIKIYKMGPLNIQQDTNNTQQGKKSS